ncbi:histidinol dehydrogenase [Natranaerobius thermophilus]|uniref:Histidinol dehydrogenase n=1 Tax=Natranaerobius thermophilus (strain ATCC BAA-1301 / DSM 18059 / JW/NM-WN-LF) TaxID=457570 RepID=B2A652_NATTJ|nr:histidinol dehydrogenase [Natranaerobius thermophilus]ACB85469.1 Histidinol dehydrogenase [Natranaerobius thermophilus JW/NM-WN-LF]
MYKLKEAKLASQKAKFEDVETRNTVTKIIDQVRTNGDKALFELTQSLDNCSLSKLEVSQEYMKQCYDNLTDKTKEALNFAKDQIEFFASQQLAGFKEIECENIPGVKLGYKIKPISSCGCYVPAGRYPLPSSALMSIVPARVAGVERIVAIAPPVRKYGGIHPELLAAMYLAGVDEVYIVGGAHGIAALALGTETISKVDFIVGPGNKYVTEAKRQLNGIVGIDQLAGPSEVLIIADNTASSTNVAADLLAQAEHDPDAVCVLVTTSEQLAKEVNQEIHRQLDELLTWETAAKSWEDYGEIILVDNLDQAIEISDQMAPEHLQLMTDNNSNIMEMVNHYGSLFVGEWASVAFGDYVSGTNHILPTGNSARFSSGLSVGKFLKMSSYQVLTETGAHELSDKCMHLAELEGLEAHKKSAELRADNNNPKD